MSFSPEISGVPCNRTVLGQPTPVADETMRIRRPVSDPAIAAPTNHRVASPTSEDSDHSYPDRFYQEVKIMKREARSFILMAAAVPSLL